MPDKHKAIELADWADWFCRNVKDPEDFRWKHLADMATELRRLHAQNAQILEALRMNAQALAWLANGKCRGFHPKLPTANDALDAARTAIKAVEKQP